MKRVLLACTMLVASAAPALASETATYTYDSQGRLKTVTSVQSGQTVTRTYSYDDANNRTSRVTTVSSSRAAGASASTESTAVAVQSVVTEPATEPAAPTNPDR